MADAAGGVAALQPLRANGKANVAAPRSKDTAPATSADDSISTVDSTVDADAAASAVFMPVSLRERAVAASHQPSSAAAETNTSLASSSLNDSVSSAATGAAARRAAEVESRHEVIALLPQAAGGSALCMNWANWNAYKATVEDGAPTLVVSFLGDTEVGKSHTIRELMNPLEDRPFVQRGKDQNASTTFNVNLYCCRSLVRDAVVHLLDFEGENGSDTPLIASARGAGSKVAMAGTAGRPPAMSSSGPASLFGLATASASLASLASAVGVGMGIAGGSSGTSAAGSSAPAAGLCSRAEAVREHFPRLAYTTSDVVALVGTDPFFSTRYLERAVDFAKRANAGVCDVDLPVLLLISNRRDGDRCVLDIKESTAQFMDAMGDSFRVLDQYFSALLCVYLPNKRATTVGDDGAVYDGESLYALQMSKLKTVLAALMKARLASRYGGADGGGSGSGSRLITCRQGLWFDLVPRVVRELNAGRPVHVTRLVDEAWSSAMAKVGSQSEAVGDILKSMVAALRPHPSLSTPAPSYSDDFLGRFAAYHALVLDLAVRVAAARLRHVDPNLRFPVRLRAYARVQLEAVLSLLDGVTPCKAVYGQGPHAAAHGETGTPVDRPEEPVMCLQEHRVHSKGHRSGRKIRGGGRTLWQKITSLVAYSPAWPGKFEACPVARPDMEGLLQDVLALVEAPPEDFMLALGQARRAHTGAYAQLVLVPLVPASASAAGPEDCDGSVDGEGLIRLSQGKDAGTPCLPYCAGCTRKVVVGEAVEAQQQADSASSAASGSAGASSSSESGRSTAWYTSVLQAVGLAGAGADTKESDKGADKGEAKPAKPIRARPAPAPLGGVPAGTLVQEVCLGLCGECWEAALASNAVERARKAQARLSMAEVE